MHSPVTWTLCVLLFSFYRHRLPSAESESRVMPLSLLGHRNLFSAESCCEGQNHRHHLLDSAELEDLLFKVQQGHPRISEIKSAGEGPIPSATLQTHWRRKMTGSSSLFASWEPPAHPPHYFALPLPHADTHMENSLSVS